MDIQFRISTVAHSPTRYLCGSQTFAISSSAGSGPERRQKQLVLTLTGTRPLFLHFFLPTIFLMHHKFGPQFQCMQFPAAHYCTFYRMWNLRVVVWRSRALQKPQNMIKSRKPLGPPLHTLSTTYLHAN